jgi:hypothetical protein
LSTRYCGVNRQQGGADEGKCTFHFGVLGVVSYRMVSVSPAVQRKPIP